MPLNKGYLTAKTTAKSDEYYTPKYAVEPLLKYIPNNSTIWCPFDLDTSEYVQCFRAAGHKVIASHIDNGQNFFYYEPNESYDYIISNPPFSVKDDILKRLNELGKPYAVLLPLPVLQGQKRFQFLVNSEALIFDKRISYFQDEAHTKYAAAPAFASIYVCKGILPEKLIFEIIKIEKNIK